LTVATFAKLSQLKGLLTSAQLHQSSFQKQKGPQIASLRRGA
jgi:hypothetical protein